MIKKIKIRVIILHSIIIVGAGHGIGILLFFDFMSISSLFKKGLEYNLNAEFQDRLMLVGLISVIGKILLVISLFVKINLVNHLIEILGIILLWISVFFLTSGNWSYDFLYVLSFTTSIPFLIYSILLTYLIVKNKLLSNKY